MSEHVFPVLHYRDAQAALEFLIEAFGFEEVVAIPGEDGAITHAELRLGGDTVMFSGSAGGIYVYVPDADAHHEQAQAAGVEITEPLRDTDYGSREYGARDPEGHRWWFGTYRPR